MRRFMIFSIIFMFLGSCALIPSKESTSLPETAVITFQRSGGLAGKTVVWTIFPDGRIVSNQSTTQVSSDDVSRLMADLKSLGILDLKDTYGGLSNCKDCFTYTITISMDNVTKTITTTERATDAPAELGKILTEINDFINKIPQQ